MFIVERVFGVTVYITALFIMCILISNSSLKSKNVYKLYILILSIMAALYVPHRTSDLFRIYNSISLISHYSFHELYENVLAHSSVPGAYLYYWTIAKTGFPFLMPAINCLICYHCIFSIFRDAEIRYNIARHNMAAVMFFTMSTGVFLPIIGGIRMMLALSLLIRAFYSEAVNGKFSLRSAIVYVIAASLHNMAVIIIIIRFIVFLFAPEIKKAKKLFIGVSLLCGICILVFTTRFEKYIFDLNQKAQFFISGKGFVDYWEYIVAAFVCIAEILVIIRVHKIQSVNENGILPLQSLTKLLTVSLGVGILFCWEFSIFHRIIVEFGSVLMTPLLAVCLEDTACAPRLKQNRYFRESIILLSFIVLLLTCSRGSISALKFFEL